LRIAIDGWGGDKAPEAIVKGIILATSKGGPDLIVTGDEQKLSSEFKKQGGQPENVKIFHAPDIVSMDEAPSRALKEKKDSSLMQAAQLVKDGQADAFISAGNTGATMAAGIFLVGRLKGIDRPGIATPVPGHSRMALLIDAGANSECKTQNLVEFALMGKVFMEKIHARSGARVGLLNVGEEPGKGTKTYQQAHEKLADNPDINFTGNVEGREIFKDVCDVVVCDGFVGNITLKVMEGAAGTLVDILKSEVKKSIRSKIGALLMKGSLTTMKERMDYEEYGGAPLLGLKAPVIICHGSSSEKAIMNAIFVAQEMVEKRVMENLENISLKNNSD